jgi:hypothetical protein
MLSENSPKQFDDVKAYDALFQGTFDIESKKWTATDVRSITAEQSAALDSGGQKSDFENRTSANENDRARSLEEQMNQVDQAAKFILPPARFAKVEPEQTGWLKKRDAAQMAEEKSKLTEGRVRALQDLLW